MHASKSALDCGSDKFKGERGGDGHDVLEVEFRFRSSRYCRELGCDVLGNLAALLDAFNLAPGFDPSAGHELVDECCWEFIKYLFTGEVRFSESVNDYRFRARVAGLRFLSACAGAFFGTVIDEK